MDLGGEDAIGQGERVSLGDFLEPTAISGLPAIILSQREIPRAIVAL